MNGIGSPFADSDVALDPRSAGSSPRVYGRSKASGRSPAEGSVRAMFQSRPSGGRFGGKGFLTRGKRASNGSAGSGLSSAAKLGRLVGSPSMPQHHLGGVVPGLRRPGFSRFGSTLTRPPQPAAVVDLSGDSENESGAAAADEVVEPVVPVDTQGSIKSAVRVFQKDVPQDCKASTIAAFLVGSISRATRHYKKLPHFGRLKSSHSRQEVQNEINMMLRAQYLTMSPSGLLQVDTKAATGPRDGAAILRARSEFVPTIRSGLRSRPAGSGAGSGAAGPVATTSSSSLHPFFRSRAKAAAAPPPPSDLGSPAGQAGETSAIMPLSKEQRVVLNAISAGHNVFFTGSAGTGKSFLLKSVIESLRRDGHGVFVTASTGIAACHIGGTSLHSFAGIGLGRKPPEVLAGEVARSRRSRQRWKEARVLIIDEVSMLSAQLFDKLDFIGRQVRDDPRPFGGIQLVLCGDFFQLPPVERGAKFAFDAKCWGQAVTKCFMLTKVFRQRDEAFVKFLNEIRFANVSQESLRLIATAGQDLQKCRDVLPTQLFAKNKNVGAQNTRRLQMLPGKEEVFLADDWGQSNFLAQLQKNCQAPTELRLKLNAQVVLLKNLDFDVGLVNGTRGTVSSFSESNKEEAEMGVSYPVVTFLTADGSKVQRHITPEKWSVSSGGREVAGRSQVPLKLAWALSIHKSQGMTISHLHVILNGVFDYGQAYVALSRATSLGLTKVDGFDPKKVRVHPRVVEFDRQLRRANGGRLQMPGVESQPTFKRKQPSADRDGWIQTKRPRTGPPAAGTFNPHSGPLPGGAGSGGGSSWREMRGTPGPSGFRPKSQAPAYRVGSVAAQPRSWAPRAGAGVGSGRPMCQYGADCYRKNPDHLRQFAHPHRAAQPGPAPTRFKYGLPPETGNSGAAGGNPFQHQARSGSGGSHGPATAVRPRMQPPTATAVSLKDPRRLKALQAELADLMSCIDPSDFA